MRCSILIKRKWQSVPDTENDYEEGTKVRLKAVIIRRLTYRKMKSSNSYCNFIRLAVSSLSVANDSARDSSASCGGSRRQFLHIL